MKTSLVNFLMYHTLPLRLYISATLKVIYCRFSDEGT